MGLWPTRSAESYRRRRPRASGDPRPVDPRSPASGEDKLRGNDMTFCGATPRPPKWTVLGKYALGR